MADERKTPRKWSLEEIDELLQDSGMLPRGGDALEYVEEISHTPKAVSFNPRPAHNENIEHRIIKDTVERSDSVAEPQVYGTFVSEKYRDLFFNKPIQNLEKTAEHQIIHPEEQKYERGGFVRKKSNFENTADLPLCLILFPTIRQTRKRQRIKPLLLMIKFTRKPSHFVH